VKGIATPNAQPSLGKRRAVTRLLQSVRLDFDRLEGAVAYEGLCEQQVTKRVRLARALREDRPEQPTGARAGP
jgi:hypothetical protein